MPKVLVETEHEVSMTHEMEDFAFGLDCSNKKQSPLTANELREVIEDAVYGATALRSRSGSTLVFEESRYHQLRYATLGDSSIFILKRRKNGECADWTCERLNVHHNAGNPSEVKRLQTLGKEFNHANRINSRAGQSRNLGLAVSRSAGDCNYEFGGLSHEPEYGTYDFDDAHEYLILTTSDVVDCPRRDPNKSYMLIEIVANSSLDMLDERNVHQFLNALKSRVRTEWHRDPSGYRHTMDDASYVAHPRPQPEEVFVGCVCDGHGGKVTANTLAQLLENYTRLYKQGVDIVTVARDRTRIRKSIEKQIQRLRSRLKNCAFTLRHKSERQLIVELHIAIKKLYMNTTYEDCRDSLMQQRKKNNTTHANRTHKLEEDVLNFLSHLARIDKKALPRRRRPKIG